MAAAVAGGRRPAASGWFGMAQTLDQDVVVGISLFFPSCCDFFASTSVTSFL
jgi:hypothetical protein